VTTAHMTDGFRAPIFGRVLSGALKAARVAFMLLGPVGLLAVAIIVRYVVFEYFHGGDETLRALWHALGA
jgi:hypothetical protein